VSISKKLLWGIQLVACLGIASINTASAADSVHYPPQQGDICTTTHIVDKDKLATYLIKEFPVSILAIEPTKDSGWCLARQLLASEVLFDPKKCKSCSSADQDSLIKINGFMASLLAGQLRSSFEPPNTVDFHTNEYFRGDNEENAIVCVIVGGQPVEPPDESPVHSDTSKSNIRIRGTATDLYIDRSDKQNFDAASKATFDLGRDYVAKKETYQIVADIGYLIPIPVLGSGDRLDIIPYVGANFNVINVYPGSNAKPSASKTVDLGLLFSTYLINRGPSPVGHFVTIQPDYLFNFADNSRLFTVNLMYAPVINNWINSFRSIAADVASGKIIINLKSDNGIYTDRGNSSVTGSNKDFVRIGGQFGASFLSDNKNVPLSLTSTYTCLHPVYGVTEIGYFSNSLTYSIDRNKYFGISLGYTNGTREDTAARENQWEIALSAHF